MQIEDQEGEDQTVTDDAATDDGTEQAQQSDPAMESRARDMGWAPKDKWRGDPEKWVDAKEFVRRGEEVLPIVTAENRRLKAELEKQATDFEKRIAGIEKMSRRAIEMERRRVDERYDALEDKAAELGDPKALRDARDGRRKALKAIDEAEAEEAKQPEAAKAGELSESDKRAVNAFWETNQTIWNSPKLRGAADEAFGDVEREMPGASIKDKLAEVRARVEEEFPTYFDAGGRQQRRAAAVEGSAGRDAGADGGSLWSKLPPEAKRQGDELIKEDGLFLDGGKATDAKQLAAARERYAKGYLEEGEPA